MKATVSLDCLEEIDFDRPFKHARRRWERRSTLMRPVHFRWAFEKCRQRHPGISTDENVLGGVPHITGTRLAVSQILGRICVLGGIDAVSEYYAPRITRDQVCEAISFAQSFVEFAGDPY